MITGLKRKFANAITEGTWRSIGGGEVICDLYINLHPQDVADNCKCTCDCDYNCNCSDTLWVGELWGSNGTRDEPWTENILDKSSVWFYKMMSEVKTDYPRTWERIVNK